MDDLTKLHEVLFAPLGVELYCFLVDYKDKQGRDFHRPFQVMGYDKTKAAMGAKKTVEDEGYTVSAVFYFSGIHTMDELERLADGRKGCHKPEVLYLNPAIPPLRKTFCESGMNRHYI